MNEDKFKAGIKKKDIDDKDNNSEGNINICIKRQLLSCIQGSNG